MTPEKQRIAIAEACGRGDYGTRMNGWHDDQIKGLPDYLHDLNAMHEAEKVLREPDQVVSYMEWLGMCYDDSGYKTWLVAATAPQRAEAFLRTVGKWEDDK